MTDEHSINLPNHLIDAVFSTTPPHGLTHTFYKYPARFSPEFVRGAIRVFSKPGDVILDPLRGSGTTLVEALVSGRHAVGSDISPLAYFVTEAKTTLLAEHDCQHLEAWWNGIQPRLNLHCPARRHTEWAEKGYQKGLPWPIRKTLEFILWEIDELPQPAQRKLARCALLRTGQWALDCTTGFPSARSFRAKFTSVLAEFCDGLGELRTALAATAHAATLPVSNQDEQRQQGHWEQEDQQQEPLAQLPSIVCLNVAAAQLNQALWDRHITKKPSLVITSPPYPQVHMLYHRWQIKGRKETAAPFWIAGELDGNGGSFYTMGSRSLTGLNNYFRSVEESFAQIHTLLADDAIVVQLIAFSQTDVQLPRYLQAMEQAGFVEMNLNADVNEADDEGHIWRKVPMRRWYASYKGYTSSSRELLLIHKRRS